MIRRWPPRNTTGSHSKREVERHRRLRRGVVVEQPRQAELAEGEQLGDADGRDGEDQPGRLGEAADDEDLDDRAEHERGEQADGDGGEERPLRADDERRGEDGGERRRGRPGRS